MVTAIVCVALLPVHRACADDSTLEKLAQRLDERIPALLKEGDVPGAVIAIGQRTGGGFVSVVRVYGWLRVEPDRVPMREDALFDMASMTKPIAAATSLMILVDQGKVSLADPVAKYLIELGGDLRSRVTVRHLLTHTSGMPAYLSMTTRNRLKIKHGFPCADAIRKTIRSTELSNTPGESVIYSCLNAVLVAELVERISGKPLDEFARVNIFEPLRMTDTGFRPSAKLLERTVPTTRADRGRGPGGFLTGQVHDPIAAMQAGVSGNAGLFSTSADLSRFAQMMLNDGQLEGGRVLSPQAVAAMTRVQNPPASGAKLPANPRGLGWVIYDAGRQPDEPADCYGHTGYTGTAIRLYPNADVYAIVLTNRVHPDDSGKVGRIRRFVWSLAAELARSGMHDGIGGPSGARLSEPRP